MLTIVNEHYIKQMFKLPKLKHAVKLHKFLSFLVIIKDTQCTSNVISSRVRVTIVRWKHKCIVVVELHVTVNYIEVLSVAQQCFYGKFVTGNNANYTYQFLKGIMFQLICILFTRYI
jgi:hypothetical protein